MAEVMVHRPGTQSAVSGASGYFPAQRPVPVQAVPAAPVVAARSPAVPRLSRKLF